MLEQLMHSLTVEGLPGQLPTEIEHDVTALVLGDQLRVGDVQLPAGVIVTNDADELIAMISVPRGSRRGRGRGCAPKAKRAPRAPRAKRAPARRRRVRGSRRRLRSRRRRAAARVALDRRAPARLPICSWSGSAIRARSTRARSTTSAPRSWSCSLAATAAGCARARSARRSTRCASAGKRLALAMPTTYMNDSGQAVAPLVRRFGVDARAARDRARRARPASRRCCG